MTLLPFASHVHQNRSDGGSSHMGSVHHGDGSLPMDLDIAQLALQTLSRADQASSDDCDPRPGSGSSVVGSELLASLVGRLLGSDDVKRPSTSFQEVSNEVAAITRLCDYKFLTYAYDAVPAAWRQMYTDAAIIRACAALLLLKDQVTCQQDPILRRCIRDLDLAFVVAGAAGSGRAELCHALVEALQQQLRSLGQSSKNAGDEAREPNRKKLKVTVEKGSDPLPNMLGHADQCIPVYQYASAPSFVTLADRSSSVRNRPFIVKGFASYEGWPAFQSSDSDRTSSSAWARKEVLLAIAGQGRVVPVEIGANYVHEDWGQDIVLWSDFLEQCGWESETASDGSVGGSFDQTLYMAQHDLSKQFPALHQAFHLPDYVFSSPCPTEDWPSYSPPDTEEGVITNLWIGPAGTVSPPHFDPYFNCFVQVVGYKEIWVAPPFADDEGLMAAFGSLQNGPVSSTQWGKVAESSTVTISTSLMTNTSTVNVFGPPGSVPKRLMAIAQRSMLEPGDLLYLPPGWWHSLQSHTRSFSVSMWF